jgi:sodium/potassium/calcium exchanger 6
MLYILTGVGALISLIIILKAPAKSPPNWVLKISCLFSFLISVMWLKFIAGCVIDLLTIISFITGVPRSFLNLTLLSWSNGFGEAFACRAMAKNGFGEMAVTSQFSGPIFDLLLGISLSSLQTLLSFNPQDNYIRMSIWVIDSTGNEVFDKFAIIPLTMVLGTLTVVGIIAYNNKANNFEMTA